MRIGGTLSNRFDVFNLTPFGNWSMRGYLLVLVSRANFGRNTLVWFSCPHSQHCVLRGAMYTLQAEQLLVIVYRLLEGGETSQCCRDIQRQGGSSQLTKKSRNSLPI